MASQRAPKDGSAGRAYGAAKGGLLAPSDIRVRAQFQRRGDSAACHGGRSFSLAEERLRSGDGGDASPRACRSIPLAQALRTQRLIAFFSDTRGVKPGRFQANRVQLALRQICMQLFALEPNLEDSVAGAAGFEPANAGTKTHIAPDPAHRKPQISAGSAILRCSRIGSNKNRDTNRDTRTRSPSLVRRRERLRAFSSKDAELFPVEVRGFRRIRGRPGLEQLPNADGEQRRHEHRQHASPP